MENKLTYSSWVNMRQRCLNSNKKDFKNYGARGITICDEWNDFNTFLKDMGERTKGMSLDRIDNDKGYSKENCRWATAKEQIRNTRVNRLITFDGKTQCMSAWADEYGIKFNTLSRRLKLGWNIKKAIETPLNKTRKGVPHNTKLITHKGKTKNIKEWAIYFGINYATLYKRITTYGFSFERAVSSPIKNNAGPT